MGAIRISGREERRCYTQVGIATKSIAKIFRHSMEPLSFTFTEWAKQRKRCGYEKDEESQLKRGGRWETLKRTV